MLFFFFFSARQKKQQQQLRSASVRLVLVFCLLFSVVRLLHPQAARRSETGRAMVKVGRPVARRCRSALSVIGYWAGHWILIVHSDPHNRCMSSLKWI